MKLKEKRIFIVEDNVANLAVFSTLLSKEWAEIFQDSWNTGTVNLLNKPGCRGFSGYIRKISNSLKNI